MEVDHSVVGVAAEAVAVAEVVGAEEVEVVEEEVGGSREDVVAHQPTTTTITEDKKHVKRSMMKTNVG